MKDPNSPDFLKMISKFPHRGIGTEYERQAATKIYKEYKNMGLVSEIRSFVTVSRGMSIYPLTYLTLTAIGIFTYLIDYPLITIILFALSASMHFRIPNYVKIYKYIFPASAHNVFAKILVDESKPNIVLTAHLDTARRTMFVKHYGKVFGGFLGSMLQKNADKLDTGLRPIPILQSPYGFFNFGMLVFLIAMTSGSQIVLYISLGIMIPFIILMYFYLTHVACTHYVNGALDNGTGIAVVMGLAKYFSINKSKNVNLYFVNSSSEENYNNGLGQLLEELKLSKENTYFINFDSVGSDYLIAAYSESDSIGLTKKFDKKEYDKLMKFVRGHNEYKDKIWTSHCPFASDMNEAVNKKHKVIVSFFGLSKDGSPPQYHQHSDVYQNVNQESMKTVEVLVRDYIETL